MSLLSHITFWTDLSQLTTTVRGYTRQVISAFAAQRTPVDVVSIGNEIRNGMLWPVGQVDWTANTGWDNLTTLLKAGVVGARAANPRGHKLLVMLHFDEGGMTIWVVSDLAAPELAEFVRLWRAAS